MLSFLNSRFHENDVTRVFQNLLVPTVRTHQHPQTSNIITCSSIATMVVLRRYATSLLLLVGTTLAQMGDEYPEYQDYAEDYGGADNLYHDYAERQNTKEVGGG
jgi:hypothetical protein